MGVLLAFLVGWSVGSKAGPTAFQELREAALTVKDSEEFTALLAISRHHAARALDGVSLLLKGEAALPDPTDLLLRVQGLTERRGR